MQKYKASKFWTDTITFTKSTNPAYKSYCISVQLYYIRLKAKCTQTDSFKVTHPSYCSHFKISSVTSRSMLPGTENYALFKVANRTLTCYTCEQKDNLNSDHSLKLWPQFGLWTTECSPQFDDNSCASNHSYPVRHNCAWSAYWDVAK
jgi:hypothetical protein